MDSKQKEYEKTEVKAARANPRLKEMSREDERLVRIMSKDIEGGMKLYPGLTKIKGISWAISGATCHALKMDKDRKIGSLTEAEVKAIQDFLKTPKIPRFIMNRRFNPETGEDSHLVGNELELHKEFDIKRMKKIKSYKGLRHAAGLPVRGQRTRSHFRKNRKKSVGIKSNEKPGEKK